MAGLKIFEEVYEKYEIFPNRVCPQINLIQNETSNLIEIKNKVQMILVKNEK